MPQTAAALESWILASDVLSWFCTQVMATDIAIRIIVTAWQIKLGPEA